MKRNYLPFTLIFLSLCFCVIYSVAQPVIGSYNVYYGHLHNHTIYSDGTGTADEAYNYAKNIAGLDFFSLSDHSELMDDAEWGLIKNAANHYNEDGTFTAFYGFEWSSVFYGHVSVFNTEDRCSLTSPTSDFSGLLAWVNARNAIAFFNHPGWAWWAWQEFNHFTNNPSDKFVGMELWNDVDGFGTYYYNDGFYGNDGAKGYFDEALTRGWKIGAAGSDDNHEATWGTRTPWRVGVLANALNREDIMNALIARRFFSTLDKNLSLSFTVNGSQMGSTVTGGNLNLQILAKDADSDDAFSKVVLVKNGAVLETINLNPWLNEVNISYSATGVNNDYFYVKVTQTDGDEAISSPVFIEGTANIAPVVSITTPTNGATFDVGNPVNIAATAKDDDGAIAKVEFLLNGSYLGEDLSAPYEYSWTPVTAGIFSLTAKAFDNLGASTVSAKVSVTITEIVQPPVPGIAESRISLGSDDAEQYQKGNVVLNSTNLNLVYDSKTTGNQIVGLLFRDLGIPQGANITNAYIEFMVDKRTTNSCSLVIKGEAADNAADFTAASNNIGSRKTTSAIVGWSPVPWKVVGSLQQTPDIKQVVQEIVNRSGWVTTSKLVIIITGSGTRNAESFEGLPSAAPLIHVEYTSTNNAAIAEKSAIKPVDEMIQNSGLFLYPNPVHDILTVRVDGKSEVERILIYSITGSLVKEITLNKVITETQVDCSNFIPGTYLLKLSSSNGSYSMQFIKQ